MQMHIDKRELTETIDALDFALLVLNVQVEQGQIGGMIATRTIEVIQGLRLAYMFAAAKEQRKDRANDAHPVTCNCLDCKTLSRLTTG
jgi:hypothetical protein